MPIRRSPASRSTSRPASAATRAQIAPTVRHAIRINSATAVFDVWTASHAAWSSNARVNREEWRAHGTAQTTTPWRRQRTRGASASTNAGVDPRSSARQRRRPSPRSNPGLRRRQTPQRSRSRHAERTATITSPSLPIRTSSTTARFSPSRRAHTLMPRTSSSAPLDSSPEQAGTLGAARRAPPSQPLTSPTATAGAPQIAGHSTSSGACAENRPGSTGPVSSNAGQSTPLETGAGRVLTHSRKRA